MWTEEENASFRMQLLLFMTAVGGKKKFFLKVISHREKIFSRIFEKFLAALRLK